MTIDEVRYVRLRRFVVAAGIFNLVAAIPLAIPFTYRYFYLLLDELDRITDLGGQQLALPLAGVNMLLVNTAGLALSLVGILLLFSSFDLKTRIGIPIANGIVRLVFTAILIYYVVVEDIAQILLLFGIVVLVFGAVLLYYSFRILSSRRGV